ncbi:MAG: hypothetical protein IJ862_04405 [Selenomonadaceae bacterium]|nr:hypothetical protein [Selenomonadaceae bacterium]
MRKVFIMAVALLMLFSGAVFAKNVTVTGQGVTSSEAENDALRMAVEKTLGVLVDSQTLVQNSMVIRDQIYTQSRGFVTNYEVTNRQHTPSGWQVTINADVDDNPNSKLMSELTRLGIIDTRLRNPRIAVYIPESHIQYRIPDPAGETAVVKALTEAGFTNVTEVGSRLSVAKPMNMSATQMTQAAQKLGVDIMIVGEAFSQGMGDAAQWLPGNQTSKMQSCRARLEAKMFIVKTGQIIAADGKYGSAIDSSESLAAKKALASAGKQMGEYFIEQLMTLGSGNRQSMQVVVMGSDFSKINRVQSALAQVRNVSNVNLSSYEGGKGIFSINYSGSPQTLFNELQSIADVDLTLQSISYNVLNIIVR